MFELDAGRLIPAQVGHAVNEPIEPQVLDAVRAQVLELLELPLFPVTGHDDDGAARLTAMDAAGQVVSIEVVDRLDAETLVAVLGRAGGAGKRGWIDVARSYPRGVAAFRRDWNAFRESQPAGSASTTRAHVVAASIDESVRPAIEALAGAGVVVHELAARAMSSGRMFLDIAELRTAVAPLPWLLPARPAASLEQVAAAAGPEPAASGDAVEVAARPAERAEPAEPSEPARPAEPHEDLAAIASSLAGPTLLVWPRENQPPREATLLPEGRIVVAGSAYSCPRAAAGAVAGTETQVDAWSGWRFGEDGPSLREARDELRAHRSRPAATDRRPGLRRRDRRRRASSG